MSAPALWDLTKTVKNRIRLAPKAQPPISLGAARME